MKTYIKKLALFVFVSLIALLQINEIVAQKSTKPNVRDHRINATKATSSTSSKHILFFDEADALFGKRSSVKNSSVKFTGKVETIRLRNTKGSGNKLIYKMPSGNKLQVYLKAGRIQQVGLKKTKGASSNAYPVQEISRYTAKESDQCLSCQKVCVETFNELGHPVGQADCQFVCTPVKCDDKRKNGVLLPRKTKK